MKYFRAVAQRFPEGGRSGRNDHELLEVDGGVGVGAAVDDVHHRYGEHFCVGAAQVPVQGLLELLGSGLGQGQGNAQNGVGAQFGLVERAVQGAHERVRRGLFRRFQADEGGRDDVADVVYGLGDALALVAGRVSVAQLPGFMFARGGSAGDGRSACGSAFQVHVRLNGGVAA